MNSCILLAAGISSRMGKPKAMLDWFGKPLINYQLNQLKKGGVDEIVVVLGYHSDEIRRNIRNVDVRIISNSLYHQGRASSLRAGAKAISATANTILVLNIDQPRTGTFIKKLFEIHLGEKNEATRPTYQGKHGHPLIINGKFRHLLISATEKELGLKGVLKKIKRISEIETDDSCLMDLNTPEDYREALDKYSIS